MGDTKDDGLFCESEWKGVSMEATFCFCVFRQKDTAWLDAARSETPVAVFKMILAFLQPKTKCVYRFGHGQTIQPYTSNTHKRCIFVLQIKLHDAHVTFVGVRRVIEKIRALPCLHPEEASVLILL